MLTVTLYTRSDCPACEIAREDLLNLQSWVPHHLAVVDVDQNPALREQIGSRVPIVEVGPYKLQAPFSQLDLKVALGAARDRADHLTAVGDERYKKRMKRGHTLSGADRFTNWLANHYTLLFNVILVIYIGLPVLAPVFMKIGWQQPAKVIYAIYKPLCHEWAFRTWFLFGEQPAYPRQLAGVQGLIPYEQATGLSSFDTQAARNFLGNPTLGYKMALCERDIAIYIGLLGFGLLFSATKWRMKALPWYLWILIGIIPIGLDGFSQIPSLMQNQWQFLSLLPIRESTPALRTLTGFLFGFTSAWFGYPYAEDSMRETRLIMARKIAVASQKQTFTINP